MRKINLIFLTLLVCTLSSFGQPDNWKEANYWMGLGLGKYSSSEPAEGFSASIDLNLNYRSFFYKARYIINEELILFDDMNPEKFQSAGILIGKGYSGKYFQSVISCGLGIVHGRIRGEQLPTEPGSGWFALEQYEKVTFFTPSIPLEAEILFKPVNFIGIGMSLFADLNIKKPLYGFTVKMGFGNYGGFTHSKRHKMNYCSSGK